MDVGGEIERNVAGHASRIDRPEVDATNAVGRDAPNADVLAFLHGTHQVQHPPAAQPWREDQHRFLMVRSHARADAVSAPKGLTRARRKKGKIHRFSRSVIHLKFDMTAAPHGDGGDAKPRVLDWTVQPFCAAEFGSADRRADAGIGFEEGPAHDATLFFGRSVPRVGLNGVFGRFRWSRKRFETPRAAGAVHAFLQEAECPLEVVAWDAVRDGKVVA